ncbi:MAG: hypothetical protein ACLFQV_03415 [Vulcanimicrobiota bacterium]
MALFFISERARNLQLEARFGTGQQFIRNKILSSTRFHSGQGLKALHGETWKGVIT